jgi:hypothetical protein
MPGNSSDRAKNVPQLEDAFWNNVASGRRETPAIEGGLRLAAGQGEGVRQ